MTSCPRVNDTALVCEFGCCADEECCKYSLAESTIIVVCVAGAALVVVAAVALICCITSKQKDRVTSIHPRQRRRMHDTEELRRPRGLPKPPPYSEAPPQYDTLQDINCLDESSVYTGATGSRNGSFRLSNVANRNLRNAQPSSSRQHNGRHPTDHPPSYVSVVGPEVNIHRERIPRSPIPGTSSVNHERTFETTIIERTRRGSPHPSLASGQISTSMTRHDRQILRGTPNERINSRFESPGQHTGSVNRHFITVSRGIGSVSPVTIREITVHNEAVQHQTTYDSVRSQQKNVGHKTRIPRPVLPQTTPSNVGVRRENEAKEKNRKAASNRPSVDRSIYDESPWPESPELLSSTATARSATRRAVMQRLQDRRSQNDTNDRMRE